jgi:DNA replication protein DnaC
MLRNNRSPTKFRGVNMLRYDQVLENKGVSMRRNVRLYQPGKTLFMHILVGSTSSRISKVLATALLDRLLYRCEVVKLKGASYRMENRKTIFPEKTQEIKQV